MEKELEKLKEEILTELPPASQLVDSLLKRAMKFYEILWKKRNLSEWIFIFHEFNA